MGSKYWDQYTTSKFGEIFHKTGNYYFISQDKWVID